MQARIVFMGTPGFSVPSLETLATRASRDDLLVVTQPDRSAGRGRRLQPPAVKVSALRLGLDVVQAPTLKQPDIRRRLESFKPDLIVVAAFGRILPRWVLDLPAHGCVNIHASRLPRFRGASPIAAAIACGDQRAGVALMEMEAGLDTGGVFAREMVDIHADDTTSSLTSRLARVGAELLDRSLSDLLGGALSPKPQHGAVIETRRLVKDHGVIDWKLPAVEVERHIRAMWPWPRAWTVGAGDTLVQVHSAEVLDGFFDEPGRVVQHADGILVATGTGGLRLGIVQLPSKQAQPARELLQHPVFRPGARFGQRSGFVRPEPWIVTAGTA